jgi:hypothetical protein
MSWLAPPIRTRDQTGRQRPSLWPLDARWGQSNTCSTRCPRRHRHRRGRSCGVGAGGGFDSDGELHATVAVAGHAADEVAGDAVGGERDGVVAGLEGGEEQES